MEIDSIEAIVSLVAHGLGVSITPRRFGLSNTGVAVRRIPFGQPQHTRVLTMISHERSARRRLADSFLAQLQQVTDQGH